MWLTPEQCIERIEAGEILPEATMRALCDVVRSQLSEESNVQPVSSPVSVVGDIHGQLWDLLELIKVGGKCPDTAYVFMVSLAVLCALVALI